MSSSLDSKPHQPLAEESANSSIFEQLDSRGYKATGKCTLPSELAPVGRVELPTPARSEKSVAVTFDSQTSALQAAAQAAIQVLNEKGPYSTASTTTLEKSIQTVCAVAISNEKELLADLAANISSATEFNVAIVPSQFSTNRVMVTLGYRKRAQVVKFSVSKHH